MPNGVCGWLAKNKMQTFERCPAPPLTSIGIIFLTLHKIINFCRTARHISLPIVELTFGMRICISKKFLANESFDYLSLITNCCIDLKTKPQDRGLKALALKQYPKKLLYSFEDRHVPERDALTELCTTVCATPAVASRSMLGASSRLR